MKIFKNDTPVIVAAKKAAMICQYSIHNPLHVFFEDYNFHYNPMDFERECNEEYKTENGELMYEFIKQFLDEFDRLSKTERRQAFCLYRKKGFYLYKKWRKKLNHSPWFKHYLAEDGHIYFETNEVRVRAF